MLVIRDKPEKVKARNIIDSNYFVNFILLNNDINDPYNYLFEYQNGKGILRKQYTKDKSIDYVSAVSLLDDYQKTSLIPPLYSEFIEAYINEQKQTERILPMIKLLQDKKPDALRELNERQEVFDKEEFNDKLNLIQTPENDCNFFIQPISINGHFSNIIQRIPRMLCIGVSNCFC